jgi:hypothetical protein
MRWPENDESLGQMAVAFQRSALRIHRRVSVRVSYGSSFRWETTHMVSDESPEESFGLVVEVLRDSCETMVAILARIQGEAFYGLSIDETFHCFTSGQS